MKKNTFVSCTDYTEKKNFTQVFVRALVYVELHLVRLSCTVV